MSLAKNEEKLFLKYLNILGIQKTAPSFRALKEIIKAQTSKIPFENISKLYYKKQNGLNSFIDFELYLEGIEKYSFGGTCYSINFYLYQLLNWLGYDVKLCGADMKNPDVHLVNIVKTENREFLVDAAYAAPFSEPLPLDSISDFQIICGEDRYVLKPKSLNNRHRVELYRKGKLIHAYSVNPKARDIVEFQQVIADSFDESSTFMNALLLTRFDDEDFIIIHNMTLIESKGRESKYFNLTSMDDLASVIEERFGIPKTIVLESLSNFQMRKDGWQ